jgi:hypothetical protein
LTVVFGDSLLSIYNAEKSAKKFHKQKGEPALA